MLRLNKYLLILIGFYVFWIGVLPFVLTNSLNLLCKNLSHNSQYELQIQKPKIYLSPIPNLVFKADKLVVKTKNNSANLDLDNIKLNLRILPLISGNFHFNTISISSINSQLSIKNKIEFDKDFFSNLAKNNIIINSVNIQDFNFKFNGTNVKESVDYAGKNFIFENKNRHTKLTLKSCLQAAQKKTNINANLYLPKNNDINKTVFEIDASNIDISSLKEPFKHYLPQNIKNLSGIINIFANKGELVTEFRNCKVLMKEPSESIIFPSLMRMKSIFSINSQTIFFKHIELDSQNIHITMDGKITDYLNSTLPILDFNIRINKSRIEDIIKIFPAFKIEEIDFYKLKKYGFYGNILANLSIKGRLPEPEVFGDVFINDGVLIKRIPNSSAGATIKLSFKGKSFLFDVNVPTGGIEKVWVKGTQQLYSVKFADFIVRSTSNVDLNIMQSVVNPLHEILNFIVGPLPILNLTGKGSIDINVKGNRKNSHIWGWLKLKNNNTHFKQMSDLILSGGNIELIFNDNNVSVKTINTSVNNKAISISGNSSLSGDFSFDIKSENQPLAKIYNSIRNSTLVTDINKMLPKLDKIEGSIDIDLSMSGMINDYNKIKLYENLFLKGIIALKNNSIWINNAQINAINGDVNLNNKAVNTEITAEIGNSPINIDVKSKNDFVDIEFNIPKLNPNLLLENKRIAPKTYLPLVEVDGKYKGNVNKIDYEGLKLNVKILESLPESILKLSQGLIALNNNKLTLKKIKGYISNPQNILYADLSIVDIFSRETQTSGIINLKIPQLSILNEIIDSRIFPEKIENTLKNFAFEEGDLDLTWKVFNNNVNAQTDLSGIVLKYKPLELPLNVINGNLVIKNNTLKLDKINVLADNMPLLVDGDIKNVFDNKQFNLYINSKPQQEFIDKYINKNQVYPIKIKGDIVYWARIKGIANNFDLKSDITMSKNSSFYHFGATVGDIENSIALYLDTKITNGNNFKIRDFSYDKLVDSLNGKQTRINMLKAKGDVEVLQDDMNFDNFAIKTTNPTDARIFNIIFRKPNIKQGQFTSDLKLNGLLSNPKIIGNFHIFESNIPFLDTAMKNIELIFKDKVVNISSKGEVMGNEVAFEGVLKNKLSLPYHLEKGELYTKNLDLNNIVNKIKTSQVDDVSTFETFENFDIKSITFDNLKFKADTISLRNIVATDFEAITKLNSEADFNVEEFKFNIAQGILSGKYGYNLGNSDMSINLLADKINANDLTLALFDLNNQIHGDMTGSVDITCNGEDFDKCMQTLNGSTTFNVKNGRMPKLGSLEYLLKASNLVKGGITGISINGVIDLISPLKTGEFSDIYGSVIIKDGVAENIEISSKGDKLSLFIDGTYNFSTSIAKMEVLGLLARKIPTILGPIGNVSINTLFNVIPGIDLTKDSPFIDKINKIPGIELSEKDYRKFVAEIMGDIDGEDYVTSFKWIN
ncbi:MAG: DUF3971 domain-containing protein [Cyanobacteria bacterium SIG28]|nr:DUF3971 domain-containing protein [Cyanobacteria bacterium SIG28]